MGAVCGMIDYITRIVFQLFRSLVETIYKIINQLKLFFQNNKENINLWLGITFFCGLFIGLIYYIINKKYKRTKTKYLEVISGTAVITAVCFNLIFFNDFSSFNKNGTSEIIMSVLPFALTIISIALSLPKDRIYGVEKTEFRKLDGANRYTFFFMMILSMVLFIVYFISQLYGLNYVTVVLAFISIAYCAVFMQQEIPLLTHSEKRVEKIIKNNIQSTRASAKVLGHHLMMKNGIRYAYTILKDKKNKDGNNIKLLHKLLDIQKNFLERYLENFSEQQTIINSDDNLLIVDVIDATLENIEYLLQFDEDCNIITICGNNEHSEHNINICVHLLSKSIYAINDICDKLNNSVKKKQKIENLIRMIFSTLYKKNNIRSLETIFCYNFLNDMLQYSLSFDELWFLEEIYKYGVMTGYLQFAFLGYVVFISLYLHYLIYIDENVSNTLKRNLTNFLSKEFTKNASISASWMSLLYFNLEQLELQEIEFLLITLLSTFNVKEDSMFWYYGKEQEKYIQQHSIPFSKKIIINWWIDYILTSANIHLRTVDKYEGATLSILKEGLNEDDMTLLVKILNSEWISEGQLIKGKKNFPFFDRQDDMEIDLDLNNYYITGFVRIIQDWVLELKLNNKQADKVGSATYADYENSFLNKLHKSIEEHPLFSLDKELNEKEIFYYYTDIEDIDKNMGTIVTAIVNSILEDIFNHLKTSEQIVSYLVDKKYDNTTLEKIIKFEPQYRTSIITYKDIKNIEYLNYLKEINNIKNWTKNVLPKNIFLKEDAFKVHFNWEKTFSKFNNLNEDEINDIIDKKHLLSNGLYRYFDSSIGGNGIKVNRKEIYDIIFHHKCKVQLTFFYKIIYDYNKILRIDIKG